MDFLTSGPEMDFLTILANIRIRSEFVHVHSITENGMHYHQYVGGAIIDNSVKGHITCILEGGEGKEKI